MTRTTVQLGLCHRSCVIQPRGCTVNNIRKKTVTYILAHRLLVGFSWRKKGKLYAHHFSNKNIWFSLNPITEKRPSGQRETWRLGRSNSSSRFFLIWSLHIKTSFHGWGIYLKTRNSNNNSNSKKEEEEIFLWKPCCSPFTNEKKKIKNSYVGLLYILNTNSHVDLSIYAPSTLIVASLGGCFSRRYTCIAWTQKMLQDAKGI